MIRGWVQLINVSVLPRAWLQLHSPELRGAQPASDRARGTSFPDHERGGEGEFWIRPERVTLTLGSDLLARVRMRP